MLRFTQWAVVKGLIRTKSPGLMHQYINTWALHILFLDAWLETFG